MNKEQVLRNACNAAIGCIRYMMYRMKEEPRLINLLTGALDKLEDAITTTSQERSTAIESN